MSFIVSGLGSLADQVSSFTQEVITEGTEEVDDPGAQLAVTESRLRDLEASTEARKQDWERLRVEKDEAEGRAQAAELQIASISQQYRGLLLEKEDEIKLLRAKCDELQHQPDVGSASLDAPGLPAPVPMAGAAGDGSVEDLQDSLSTQSEVNRLSGQLSRLKAENAKWKASAAAAGDGAAQSELIALTGRVAELEAAQRDAQLSHQDELATLQENHMSKLVNMNHQLEELQTVLIETQDDLAEAKAAAEEATAATAAAATGPASEPGSPSGSVFAEPTEPSQDAPAARKASLESVLEQQKTAALAEELSAVQQHLSEASSQLIRERHSRRRSSTQMDLLGFQNRELQEQLKVQQEAFEEDLRRLQGELQTAHTRIAALDEAEDRWNLERTQARIETENLEQRISSMDAERRQLIATASSLKAKLKGETVKPWQQDARSSPQQPATGSLQWQEERTRLEMAVSDAQAEKQTLSRDLEDLQETTRDAIRALRDERKTLKARVEGLEGELATARSAPAQATDPAATAPVARTLGDGSEMAPSSDAQQAREAVLTPGGGGTPDSDVVTGLKAELADRTTALEAQAEQLAQLRNRLVIDAQAMIKVEEELVAEQAAGKQLAAAQERHYAEHATAVAALRHETTRLETELASATASAAAKAAELQAQVDGLTAASAARAQGEQDVSAQATGLQNDVARLEAELASRQRANAEALQQHRATEAELRQQLERAEDGQRELEARCRGLTEEARAAAAAHQQALSAAGEEGRASAQAAAQELADVQALLQQHRMGEEVLRKQIAESEEKLRAAEAAYASAVSDAASEASELQLSAQRSEQQEGRLAALTAQLASATQAAQAQASELAEARRAGAAAVADLEARLAEGQRRAGAEVQAAQQRVQAAEAARVEAQQVALETAAATQRDMQAAHTQGATVAAQLEAMRAERDTLAERLQRAGAEHEDATREAERARGEAATLRETMQVQRAVGDSSEALRSEHERAKAQLKSLQQHLLDVENRYTEDALKRDETITFLQGELKESRDKIDQRQDGALKQLQQAERRIDMLEGQGLRAASERDKSQRECETLLEANRVMKRSLANLESVLSGFEAEKDAGIAAAKNAGEQARQALDVEVGRLTAELDAAQARVAEDAGAAQQAGRMLADNNVLNGLVSSLRADVERLQRDLGQAKAQLVDSLTNNQDSAVDKGLMRNTFVRYFSTPKKRDVLALIANMLDFDEDDRLQVGLGEQRGFFGSLLQGPVSPPKRSLNSSFTEEFVRFLLEEANPAGGAGGSSATSTTIKPSPFPPSTTNSALPPRLRPAAATGPGTPPQEPSPLRTGPPLGAPSGGPARPAAATATSPVSELLSAESLGLGAAPP